MPINLPRLCLRRGDARRRLPLRAPRPPLVGEPLLALLRPSLGRSLEHLFAPEPITRTLGDDGLFGPQSVVWRVHGDVSVFVGAIRALLIQALHPEVVAGVVEHSGFRDDALHRLQNTSRWVTRVIFASTPDAHRAIDGLAALHERVVGVSHRGRPYRASEPALLAWVHNAFVDSFLAAYRRFGPGLTNQEADRYVLEMTRLGRLLGCDELPASAPALRAWLCEHPDVADSPGLRESIEFLGHPPLSTSYRIPYFALHQGALAIVPEPLAPLIGRPLPAADVVAETVLVVLRTVLPAPGRAAAATRTASDSRQTR